MLELLMVAAEVEAAWICTPEGCGGPHASARHWLRYTPHNFKSGLTTYRRRCEFYTRVSHRRDKTKYEEQVEGGLVDTFKEDFP